MIVTKAPLVGHVAASGKLEIGRRSTAAVSARRAISRRVLFSLSASKDILRFFFAIDQHNGLATSLVDTEANLSPKCHEVMKG